MKHEYNDVSSFFYYMWNSWSEKECEICFQNADCGWEWMWHKWNQALDNAKDFDGAVPRFYAYISETYRNMMVNRACMLYDGPKNLTK